MSSDCMATCWTPGPPWNSRYSSIWLFRFPSAGSLIGNLIFPSPSVMTFDMSAEYSVEFLVREVRQLREAKDARVELDPLVHAAELDVADDMVDRDQATPRPGAVQRDGDVPGQVWA